MLYEPIIYLDYLSLSQGTKDLNGVLSSSLPWEFILISLLREKVYAQVAQLLQHNFHGD